jgi:hypothetical protein
LARGGINHRGELLRWHYDEYSLGAMLRDAGFRDIRRVGPTESRIQSWAAFHLDTNDDGTVHKPRALYMEAVK